jgi:AbrB family looped-hinge helix DNA binding protein
MTTAISSKGQIVLPAELRELDEVRPGQSFAIERVEAGCYVLKRETQSPNAGAVDWLLSCPEKNWFQSLPSESTDTL